MDEVKAIAGELKQSASAVAVRWLLQRPLVSSVIIGPRTLAHLRDNLTAVEFELSAEQMQRLSNVSRTAMPYPFDIIAEMNKREQD